MRPLLCCRSATEATTTLSLVMTLACLSGIFLLRKLGKVGHAARAVVAVQVILPHDTCETCNATRATPPLAWGAPRETCFYRQYSMRAGAVSEGKLLAAGRAQLLPEPGQARRHLQG